MSLHQRPPLSCLSQIPSALKTPSTQQVSPHLLRGTRSARTTPYLMREATLQNAVPRDLTQVARAQLPHLRSDGVFLHECFLDPAPRTQMRRQCPWQHCVYFQDLNQNALQNPSFLTNWNLPHQLRSQFTFQTPGWGVCVCN